MALYTATVFENGQQRKVDINADSPASARMEAETHGNVIKIKKATSIFNIGLTEEERAAFLSKLGSMLGAGMSVGDSLKLMNMHYTGRIKQVSNQIFLLIEEGNDLPTALEMVGEKHFPASMLAMIRAGYESGQSHKAIRDAQDFHQELIEVKRKSVQGIWSAVVGYIAAVIFTVMSIYWFTPAVMSSGLIEASENIDVEWAIDMNRFLGILVIGVAVFTFAFMSLGTWIRAILPITADAIILRIPYYKHIVLAKMHFIALYGLSILVKTGVPLSRALDLTINRLPRGALQEDFKKAREAVVNGENWTVELKTLHPTDRAALAGSMDRLQVATALESVGRHYKDTYMQLMAALIPGLQMLSVLMLTMCGFAMFGVTILPMLQMAAGGI